MFEILDALNFSLMTLRYALCIIVAVVYFPAAVGEFNDFRHPSSYEKDRESLLRRLAQLGTDDDRHRRLTVAALLFGMGVIVLGFLISGTESMIRGYGLGDTTPINSAYTRTAANVCFVTGLSIKLIPNLQARFGPYGWLKWFGFTAAATLLLTAAIVWLGQP